MAGRLVLPSLVLAVAPHRAQRVVHPVVAAVPVHLLMAPVAVRRLVRRAATRPAVVAVLPQAVRLPAAVAAAVAAELPRVATAVVAVLRQALHRQVLRPLDRDRQPVNRVPLPPERGRAAVALQ